jgi:hypothetical protein
MWIVLLLAAAGTGCVQRKMTIDSSPPGALVWLNDQEIGRTPVTKSFIWYGNYQVELRKEGFEKVKTHQHVSAPWWQWVPFDFFAEFFPVTDRQKFSFSMKPMDSTVDPKVMEVRGEVMGERLQSGLNYREKPPTTRKSKASTRETTRPTTQPGAEPTGF